MACHNYNNNVMVEMIREFSKYSIIVAAAGTVVVLVLEPQNGLHPVAIIPIGCSFSGWNCNYLAQKVHVRYLCLCLIPLPLGLLQRSVSFEIWRQNSATRGVHLKFSQQRCAKIFSSLRVNVHNCISCQGEIVQFVKGINRLERMKVKVNGPRNWGFPREGIKQRRESAS